MRFVDAAGNGVAETRGQKSDPSMVLRKRRLEVAVAEVAATTSGLIGDLDQDGDVDFADFFVIYRKFWQDEWIGKSGTHYRHALAFLMLGRFLFPIPF